MSGEPSGRILDKLSPDVLVNILKFLSPKDIIPTRQTSKSLYAVTKLRTVWLNALRFIMVRYSITEAIFPLQKMTLSMLEHIALSPYRFAALVEKYHESTTQPTSIRTLSTRFTDEEKKKYGLPNSGRVDDFLMALGGRYLVTLSYQKTQQSTLFTLWDLGLGGDEAVKAVARFLDPAGMTGICCLSIDPTDSEVLYLISVQQGPPRPVIFAHKVSLAGTPQISSFRKLEISATVPYSDCEAVVIPDSSTLVISTFYDGRFHFWVWDVLANAATILWSQEYIVTDSPTVLPYNDCIMVIIEGQILVYNIPPLVPLDSRLPLPFNSPVILTTPPTVYFSSFFVVEDFESPTSSANPDLPPYMLVVDHDQLIVLEIKDSNPLRNDRLPNKLPIVAETVNFTDPVTRLAAQKTVAKKCEDHMFFVHYDESAFLVSALDVRQLYDVDQLGTSDVRTANATLEFSMSFDGVHSKQFSPILGRFCILTDDNDVHIFDYLVPPDRDDLYLG